jgi:hypothetical protein
VFSRDVDPDKYKNRLDYKQQQALLLEPHSLDEFEMFVKFHQDQDDPGLVGRRAHDEPGFRGLRASRLVTESWEMVYPEQENVPKKIFGGYLIRCAFELSSICCELAAPDRIYYELTDDQEELWNNCL